jgi:sugar/nucleoside kinase (ribokinase family)
MPTFDVTIAGEVNLDLILYGLPEQLEPERELLADGMMLTLGGSSSIVAHNLAALGAKVGFQSRIGDDPLGQIAVQRLAESGADVSRVRRTEGSVKSGLSVILHHPTWRNILTYSGTIGELSWEDLDFSYLTDSRHFHLSSFYLQSKLTAHVPELFRRVKAAGLSVSLDTNDDPQDTWGPPIQEALRYVDILMPNEREAKKLAGQDDLEAAVAHLASIVPLVVVKMGKDGAMAQRGKERFTSPALRVDARDAVGAGDSFDAGFLSAYLRGANLTESLASGNRAGALSTTRPGGTEAFRDQAYRQKFLTEHSR